eukprot:COSAG04_NODE_24062_length_327_cov_2.438596_1_plen_49_part_01
MGQKRSGAGWAWRTHLAELEGVGPELDLVVRRGGADDGEQRPSLFSFRL